MRKCRYDWSEVDPYLIAHYLDETYSSMAKKFPQFSASQIRDRARTIGIPSKHKKSVWTTPRKNLVRLLYSRFGARVLSNLLNVSIYAVEKEAQFLSLKRIYKHEYYSIDGYLVVGKMQDRMFAHRKVMEEHLGRKLSSNEIVHHIDGDKSNNDISNLMVVSRAEHLNIHRHRLHK